MMSKVIASYRRLQVHTNDRIKCPRVQVFGPLRAHKADISCAAFSSLHARILAVGSHDRTVTFWRLPLSSDIRLPPPHSSMATGAGADGDGPDHPVLVAQTSVLSAFSVSCVAWHPLKPLLLAACRDGIIHVLDSRRFPQVPLVDTLALPSVVSTGLQASRTRWRDALPRGPTDSHTAVTHDVVATVAGCIQHVHSMLLVQPARSHSPCPSAIPSGDSNGLEAVLVDSTEWVACCGNAVLSLHGGAYTLMRLMPLGSRSAPALKDAAARCGVAMEPSGPFLAGTAACAAHSSGRVVCVLGALLGGDVGAAWISPLPSCLSTELHSMAQRAHCKASSAKPAAASCWVLPAATPCGWPPGRSIDVTKGTAWKPLDMFPRRGVPAASAPMCALHSAPTKTQRPVQPKAAATNTISRSVRKSATSSREHPVTFHTRIQSSGYGLTYGKTRLGQQPPKPKNPTFSGSSSTSTMGRLIAELHAYPLHALPPAQQISWLQVHSAAVTGMAYSPDGTHLGLCGRDARAVTVRPDKLAGRCGSGFRNV
jgi:hypothetical protein